VIGTRGDAEEDRSRGQSALISFPVLWNISGPGIVNLLQLAELFVVESVQGNEEDQPDQIQPEKIIQTQDLGAAREQQGRKAENEREQGDPRNNH